MQIEFADAAAVTTARGYKLLDGVVFAGQLSKLNSSDDQYFELDPSPSSNLLKQKVHIALQSTSPAGFTFRLEAGMTGGQSGGRGIFGNCDCDSQKNVHPMINSTVYNIYQLDMHSVANPATANSVQLSEIEVIGIPESNQPPLLANPIGFVTADEDDPDSMLHD